MKKAYINPNTEIHEFEMQQMCAATKVTISNTRMNTSAADANEYEMTETSGSIWDEEE